MVERVNSRILGDAKNRSAFGVNAPSVIKGAAGCNQAPREQLGVQCLAQGHFSMQLMGRAGIKPGSLWLPADHFPPRATAHFTFTL